MLQQSCKIVAEFVLFNCTWYQTISTFCGRWRWWNGLPMVYFLTGIFLRLARRRRRRSCSSPTRHGRKITKADIWQHLITVLHGHLDCVLIIVLVSVLYNAFDSLTCFIKESLSSSTSLLLLAHHQQTIVEQLLNISTGWKWGLKWEERRWSPPSCSEKAECCKLPMWSGWISLYFSLLCIAPCATFLQSSNVNWMPFSELNGIVLALCFTLLDTSLSRTASVWHVIAGQSEAFCDSWSGYMPTREWHYARW